MVKEGKRKMVNNDEISDIKKGPWKPEEDQVLIKHVKKYGPRDWSSIRSKGLLQRTGKSCRLRWVNKLRPDLKNGVKFSPDEERTVIDLQAQFGNRWAKIATYLTGRTDNDVKNFWSSRQKRLARTQETPAVSPKETQRSTVNEVKASVLGDLSSAEMKKLLSSSPDEESVITKSQSCSSHFSDTMMKHELVPLPQLVNPISCYTGNTSFPLDFTYENKPFFEQQSLFPRLQPDFVESQDLFLMTRNGDPCLMDVFGNLGEPTLSFSQLPTQTTMPLFGEVDSSFRQDNVTAVDNFIEELPLMDLFDEIERLPSPSKWP